MIGQKLQIPANSMIYVDLELFKSFKSNLDRI
jgi:hypothetical protein